MKKHPGAKHASIANSLTEALIARFELPNCNCYPESAYAADADGNRSLPPPCKHMREAKHDVSLESWGRLLSDSHPEDYAEPDLPPMPETFTTRDDELNVMTERVEAGYARRHPLDKRAYCDGATETNIGPGVHHADNGCDVRDHVQLIQRDKKYGSSKPHFA